MVNMNTEPAQKTMPVPISLQTAPPQHAHLPAAPDVVNLAALQAYQAFLASGGFPLAFAVAPPGIVLPNGLPAFPAPVLPQLPFSIPPPAQQLPTASAMPSAHTGDQCGLPPIYSDSRYGSGQGAPTTGSESPNLKQCSYCSDGGNSQTPAPENSVCKYAPDNSFRCSRCTKSFVHLKTLENHVRQHHPHPHYTYNHQAECRNQDDAQGEFSCLFCDRVFSSEKTREEHMISHNSERPYSCSQCPWAFTDRWKLAAHQRTHSGLRPYACPQCHESFSQKPTLTRHMRTHTGERPYICAHCPATFLDSKNLSRHMRVHDGKRGPYVCNKCTASFNRKQMLTAHQRVHNGAVSGRLGSGKPSGVTTTPGIPKVEASG